MYLFINIIIFIYYVLLYSIKICGNIKLCAYLSTVIVLPFVQMVVTIMYIKIPLLLELCPFEIHTFLDKVDRGPETEQEGAGKDMTSDMVDVEDEDQYFEMEYNEVSKAENVVQQMEDDDWEMEDDDLEMEVDDLERDEDKWEMDKEYDTEELDFDPLNSNKQKVTYDETRTAQHYNQLEDMVIQHFLKIDIVMSLRARYIFLKDLHILCYKIINFQRLILYLVCLA